MAGLRALWLYQTWPIETVSWGVLSGQEGSGGREVCVVRRELKRDRQRERERCGEGEDPRPVSDANT